MQDTSTQARCWHTLSRAAEGDQGSFELFSAELETEKWCLPNSELSGISDESLRSILVN